MVKSSSCGRQVEKSEIMYTIPWLPYGHETGQTLFEESIGTLYSSEAGQLTVQRCGLTYSHDRGMWLCKECAYKNGYLW